MATYKPQPEVSMDVPELKVGQGLLELPNKDRNTPHKGEDINSLISSSVLKVNEMINSQCSGAIIDLKNASSVRQTIISQENHNLRPRLGSGASSELTMENHAPVQIETINGKAYLPNPRSG